MFVANRIRLQRNVVTVDKTLLVQSCFMLVSSVVGLCVLWQTAYCFLCVSFIYAALAIERFRVRITFATVSKFGHFRSLHDAPVHSAV